MKSSLLLIVVSMLVMTGCASVPESVKDDCAPTGKVEKIVVQYDPRDGKGLQMFDTQRTVEEWYCPSTDETLYFDK